MHYQTKEMRPNKVGEVKEKYVIEVRNTKTGHRWSLTTSDRQIAQEMLDSLNYKTRPILFSKENKFTIKVEV